MRHLRQAQPEADARVTQLPADRRGQGTTMFGAAIEQPLPGCHQTMFGFAPYPTVTSPGAAPAESR